MNASHGTQALARQSYARVTSSVPRSFSIIGTTNSSSYLPLGVGGIRRFGPVLTGLNGFKYDTQKLLAVRDQLFGEAAVAAKAGEVPNVPAPSWGAEAIARDERTATEPVFELLEERIGDQHGFVSNASLKELLRENDMDYERLARNQTVTNAFQKLGFKRKKRGSERGFLRGNDDTCQVSLSVADTEHAKKARNEKLELERLRREDADRRMAARQRRERRQQHLALHQRSNPNSHFRGGRRAQRATGLRRRANMVVASPDRRSPPAKRSEPGRTSADIERHL